MKLKIASRAIYVLSGKSLKFARDTKMRRFAGLAVAGAALVLLIPRQAESFTYGRLVAGQVQTDLAYGTGSWWCLVDTGIPNCLF
jgi:hypothetical protein